METNSNTQKRQIKSNENSPVMSNDKNSLKNHHRTKAVIENVAFNSLSQNSNKFYTITIDEEKINEGLTSKLIQKIKGSNNQKKLVIEEIDNYYEGKKDFLNFKFGKKYYKTQLKNPLFASTQENPTTNNSNSNNRAESLESITPFSNNEKNIQNNFNEINSEKKSQSSFMTKRNLSNTKLSKYFEKLKKSNINIESLKDKIATKNQRNNLVSKSLNFQKIVDHKFNSNSLLESKTKNKFDYGNSNDFNLFSLANECDENKNKLKLFENEIHLIKEKNMQDKQEMLKIIEGLECRIYYLEKYIKKNIQV